jgi:hypothetical protein
MGFFLNNAQAEEVEYQVVNYLVGVNYIPVPDVDKHAIGTYERRGVAIFKNGETAAFHTRGLWDFVNHNGVFNGYQTLTFPDGSTNMIKYSGNMTTEGENLPTLKAKGEYVKGTGKYEGIKGNVTIEGKYITPYSKETKADAVFNQKASYTLPK